MVMLIMNKMKLINTRKKIELIKMLNPMMWRKEESKNYPNVSKLIKKYLCIPSISTPSERALFTADNIRSHLVITDKRNCLSGKTAKWLIFLSHNS